MPTVYFVSLCVRVHAFKQGFTPLFFASDRTIFELLVRAGADVNAANEVSIEPSILTNLNYIKCGLMITSVIERKGLIVDL